MDNKEKLIDLVLKILGLSVGGFILFHAFRFVFKTIMFLFGW